MAVPISEIVRVKVSSTETQAIEQNQNGCCLTPNPLVPIGEDGYLIAFQNLNKVGEYFGIDSTEYKQAEAYFSGYQGVNEQPDLIWFGRLVDQNVAPYITNGLELTANRLLELKNKYTNSVLNFLFNNEAIPVTFVEADFANISKFAERIQTALRANTIVTMADATAVVNANNTITVSSNMAGDGNTVLPCTSDTDLLPPAVINGFANDCGFSVTFAITSQGATVSDFAKNFDDITYNDTPFLGFWLRDGIYTDLGTLNITLILQIAEYLANQNDQYLFSCVVKSKEDAQSLIGLLKENQYAKKVVLSDNTETYDLNTPFLINSSPANGEKLSAWIIGAMAIGQDYHYPMNKTNGLLIGENMTDKLYQQYLALACNVYCRFKGTNPLNTYRIGRCGDTGANVGLYGSQNSIDKFYGQNRIRKDIQDSVSYRMIISGESIGADTNTGSTAVKNLIVAILQREVNRGWIAVGKQWTTLQDQETLRQLSRNLEVDQNEIANALTTTGYWVSQGEYISDLETMRYFIAYVSQGAVLTVDINLNATNY